MTESAKQRQFTPAAVVAGALLGGGLVAGGVLFVFDPRRYHFYPTCFFHQTTGLLCAGCGALRALHQLLHGHLVTAFRFNPLVIVSLPLVAWLGGKLLLQKAKGQRVSLGLRPIWLWVGLAVLAGFTVLRNVPALAFGPLPP
jgi:hypothetical protein